MHTHRCVDQSHMACPAFIRPSNNVWFHESLHSPHCSAGVSATRTRTVPLPTTDTYAGVRVSACVSVDTATHAERMPTVPSTQRRTHGSWGQFPGEAIRRHVFSGVPKIVKPEPVKGAATDGAAMPANPVASNVSGTHATG